MTQFAIVRHGVTDWNMEGRMQGHRDIPLNDMGLIQANQIAERLKHDKWDMIVSSDLQRAAQTAKSIADAAGIERRVRDPRLRERNFGALEGTTIDERVAIWGSDWMQLDHGIEDDAAIHLRALQCLEELANQNNNQNIIVVTHGGWISQFFKHTFPLEMLEHPNNTSLSIVGRDPEGWRHSLYNCTTHLKSI